MGASAGGSIYVFHARVVCSDITFGQKLALTVRRDQLESVRAFLKEHHGAERIYLSYEEIDNETDNKDNM